MSSVRPLAALLLAGLLAAAPAIAQRVVAKTPEPSSAPRSPGAPTSIGTVGGTATSLPQASLTPSIPYSPAPQLVIQEPLVLAAPAPAGGAPPACYPKSQGDCANEAASCLAGEFVNANYEVRWDAGGPYIYRTYWTSEGDEAMATDCAADLNRCLASGC